MKQPKIHIDRLIIEVTRKCNMTCAHCLRGDAQNVDIDPKLIRKLIKQCDTIKSITITGGEPTLNISGIKTVFDT